jgi:CBS domain-containing protein
MTIASILQGHTGPVYTITAQATVREATTELAGKRIGALPVVEGEQVIGIFSERDVIYGLARDGHAFLDRTVGETMTSPVFSVAADTAILAALSLMTKRRIRHLPVTEGDRLTGFVSIGDLVKHRIEKIEAEANAMREYIQMA